MFLSGSCNVPGTTLGMVFRSRPLLHSASWFKIELILHNPDKRLLLIKRPALTPLLASPLVKLTSSGLFGLQLFTNSPYFRFLKQPHKSPQPKENQ